MITDKQPFNVMKKLIFLLFLILPLISNAQTISCSPTSILLWGKAPKTMKISVEYKNVEFVTAKVIGTYYINGISSEEYSGYYFGLFYKPLNIEYKNIIFKSGFGFWNRPFPSKGGQRLHFTIEANYQITDNISAFYSHMSNGFGIMNDLNTGLDSIGMKLHF